MIKRRLIFLLLLSTTILFSDNAYKLGIKAMQSHAYESALRYFYISARHYNVNAYDKLGVIHDEGLGTGVNKRTAFYWYEKAARHGQAEAQYRLGRLYEHGEGVKKDMQRATHWYRRAARNGNREARIRLGAKKAGKASSPEHNSSKKSFDLTTLWK